MIHGATDMLATIVLYGLGAFALLCVLWLALALLSAIGGAASGGSRADATEEYLRRLKDYDEAERTGRLS